MAASADHPWRTRARGEVAEKLPATRLRGVIERFDERGFGWILESSRGWRVFLHASAVPRCYRESLREGAAVTFDCVAAKRGLRAANVAPA